MKRSLLIFAAILTALAAGCASSPSSAIKRALRAPEKAVLYSLYPIPASAAIPPFDSHAPPTNTSKFEGYYVLGQITLNNGQSKKAIASVCSNVHPPPPGVKSACGFSPRHGLEITTRDKTYDLLLCYQCGKIEIIGDDAGGDFELSGSPGFFNKLLDAAKIPRD